MTESNLILIFPQRVLKGFFAVKENFRKKEIFERIFLENFLEKKFFRKFILKKKLFEKFFTNLKKFTRKKFQKPLLNEKK